MPQPDPAPKPQSTASHPAAAGSSFVTLSPVSPPPAANTDDSPTVITAARTPDGGIGVDPGTRLGHFEVIGTVGAGGMAAVLKARDLELGRVVALKILPPAMARDQENVARFKQEARAAARLDHDNIARVFFCGEDQGLHFIAFEFVEGDNLRQLIDRRKTVPAAECVRYMVQAAAGLAHAAVRGVVHRDVKPSNLVISPDGRAKIVDMGLARSLTGQTVNGGVTQSGVTLGTFDYISPEQALDPRRADVRSDIYSLGCAFYHALTGRPPVPEGTAAKKLHAHQHEPVTDPRVLNPNVPDGLAAVLARMMAKDPARRYQTPADLIADLTVLAGRLNLPLDGVPVDSSAVHPALPGGRALTDPPRVPLGLVAAAAGLVVGVAVLVGGGSDPARAPTPPPWAEPVTKAGGPELVPPPHPVAPPTTPRPPDPHVAADDAAALARFLRDPAVTEIRLGVGQTYDLRPLPGVVIGPGRSVTVLGAAGPNPPVVKLAAVPVNAARFAGERPGTLTVYRAESVRFDGVRFEVVDPVGPEDAPEETVGLAVVDTPRAEFVGCRFDAAADLRNPVVGLGVTREQRADFPATASVRVENGLFAVRRGVGLRLAGRVRADLDECGFAPHPAAVELVGDPVAPPLDPPGGDLRLTHCTFLLDQKGAAVRAEDGGGWAVSAGFCLFAAPPPADGPGMGMMMTDPADRRPAVLRVVTERHDFDARFAGRPGEPNAYYRVDPLTVGAKGYTLDDCRTGWSVPPVSDPDAVPVGQSPWASADPVSDLLGPAPWRAMRLKTTFRPVQVPRTDDKLIGLRFFPRRTIYDAWPPTLQADAAANAREKVWYPDPPAEERNRLARNEFTSLAQAVDALKPDDVLLVRHTGPLPVPPAAFDRPKLRATVRPHPGFAPVLVPAPGGRADAALFRVGDGDLTLEGLELHLRPRADAGTAARSVAGVAVAGGGRVTLRDCVISLDEQGTEKLAAVAVAEPDGDARGPARRPAVAFEHCLIRGKGRGVWVPAARPFDLVAENTTAALAGAFVAVGPPSRPAPAGATSTVVLNRVTAFLAGPVLDLRPSPPDDPVTGDWVPVDVTAGRCVFAGVGKAGPVVLLAAAGPPERFLSWKPVGKWVNWYARRPLDAAYLDATAPDAKGLAGDDWFRFTGETPDLSVAKLTFADAPTDAGELAAVKPADLEVTRVDLPDAAPDEAGAEARRVARPGDATDRR